MKQIRVLSIVFQPEIHWRQIPLFRGAIIAKAGRDCVLFHNHTKDGYRYSYPKIQYKRIGKNASMVCVDEGIDEIYRLFNAPDWKVRIGEQETELKIKSMKINKFNLNIWDKKFRYVIRNWLALNEKNYKIYMQTQNMPDKFKLLENILTANILSFAKGVDWHIEEDKKIEVNITKILKEKKTWFKGNPLLAFDVEFTSNVFIPSTIGLGKAASHGYGVVFAQRNHKPSKIDKKTQS